MREVRTGNGTRLRPASGDMGNHFVLEAWDYGGSSGRKSVGAKPKLPTLTRSPDIDLASLCSNGDPVNGAA